MEDRGDADLNIEQAFRSIIQTKADFFTLPEFFAIPEGDHKKKYTAEECWRETGKPALDMLKRASRYFRGYIIGGTVIEKNSGKFYNTCPVFKHGQLVTKHRKVHLIEDDFKLGITPGKETTYFNTPFGRIGLLVCADFMDGEIVKDVVKYSDYIFLPMSLTDPNKPISDDLPISLRIARKYLIPVINTSRISIFGGKKLTSKSSISTPDAVIFKATNEEELAIVEFE